MSFRILIVEDEQIIAADLEELLVEMGHEVLGIAASGHDAVRLSLDLRPQLVPMDFQLGSGMAGDEVANRIRALTDARIIFITALPELVGRGALCIGKPFFRPEIRRHWPLPSSARSRKRQRHRASQGIQEYGCDANLPRCSQIVTLRCFARD